LFANLKAKRENLCLDLIENQGHYFGAALPAEDKVALMEYLKTK